MTDQGPPSDRGIGLTAPVGGLGGRPWVGSRPVFAARRRRRWPAILAVVVILVVVGGAVAYFLFGRSSSDPDRRQAAAFLSAWSAGDTATMQSMVSPPAQVARDLTAATAGLHLTRATYELDNVDHRGDTAVASFTARDEVGGVGAWTYHGSFPLVPGAHGPVVQWSRAVIHPSLRPGQVLERTFSWHPRAPILGAGGQVLYGTVDVVTVGVEPRRMTDEQGLTNALHTYLHVAPATVTAALHAPGVRPDEFVPIVTVARPSYEAVKPAIYPIPGLEFRAHKGNAAASLGSAQVLLGDVGPITAEQLKQFGPPYDATDQVGRSGLEAAYERTLAGTPAADIFVVDPTIADRAHRVTAVVLHTNGRMPQPLRTTIDPAVQQAADLAMVSVTKPAALVAVDGQGRVRAVVSTPTDQQFDRALDGEYPPGSTFKVVTTDALLAAGTTPSSSLTCPSEVTVDGKTFHNFEHESTGALSLTTAFARSCNTAFIGAAQQHLSADRLAAAARTFGFGVPLHLGVAGVGGSFPDGGDQVETAADAIGQGRVTASPLQMATVAATVMTGQWRPPMLLTDHTGTTAAPPPLSPTTRAQLTGLMRAVVTSGTGTAANVPGLIIMGKTGTAEFGHAQPPQTHAWFIGFSGNLAIAVLVEGGGVGGQTAAPIARTFFQLAR